MNKDELVIAEALNGMVRIRACRATDLIEKMHEVHNTAPTSTAALGRVMIVNAIMASDLKDEKAKCVVTINGHGPAGTIVSQATPAGKVRGFISNPDIYLVNEKTGKLDVGRAVGTNGSLNVTKDLGLKEPFTGVVELQTGEIGDDFAYYFAMSEQIPSVVSVGVLVGYECHVKAAGGILIQMLPNASEEAYEYVEKLTKEMKPVSTYIDEGLTPEEIIHTLLNDAKVLGRNDLEWYCGCSKEHFMRALSLISQKDIEEMIQEGKGAHVKCQYCEKEYDFTQEDLKEVLDRHVNMEHRKDINC